MGIKLIAMLTNHDKTVPDAMRVFEENKGAATDCWGFKDVGISLPDAQKLVEEMKKAVECGYWNLFRYNPALKAEGKNPFTLDSKAPTGSYRDFIMNEARYSSLVTSFPDRAEELFEKAEKTAEERYEELAARQK